MLSELAQRKAKLKGVTTKVEDASHLSGGPPNLIQEWAEEQGLTSHNDLLTARKQFFDTSLDIARAHYKPITETLAPEAILPSSGRPLTETEVRTLVGFWGNHTGASSVSSLADLAGFVDDKIKAYGGRAFVKLGTRSPKDITWTHEKTMRLYSEYLKSKGCSPASATPGFLESKGAAAKSFEKLELLYRAQIDCMAVTSWSEALSFFLESTRVLFDLQLALVDPKDINIAIVVRPWEKIPLSAEWRAFVYKGELKAISQYFTDLFFPTLPISSDGMKARIIQFYESNVKQAFVAKGLLNCVVDFVAEESGPVRVLEVNQWADSTGSGLFDWTIDRTLLTEGTTCPIRVRTGPVPLETIKIPKEWTDLIHSL